MAVAIDVRNLAVGDEIYAQFGCDDNWTHATITDLSYSQDNQWRIIETKEHGTMYRYVSAPGHLINKVIVVKSGGRPISPETTEQEVLEELRYRRMML